ncbi:MarR family winged helix-turn-helix transcriptional regulator [Amycolatopsis sp. NPDC005232]|uniref:MarR family winged helix-turn-helix transcriptional regulator n=1 Tax=unclassified Amycolatopsis TaxID=2618356 RepID=UPI001C6A675F|nr:MarR family winged helix-turn-helix transcriptional regulator [Amycolatopsis sp. DSM 110486]QYN22345.1 MarR family winged helix-turn-helix transcriptional regulator [Amycolatopsis sp. DSM 110486]
MTDARWLDERELHVWKLFHLLQRSLNGAIDRQLVRDAGLSGPDYTLMVPLSEAPGDVLRMRDLGMQIRWDRSRLSHHVSRMEKRGLVTREDCSDDARGAMVRLTPAGREAIEAAAPEHVETVRRYFFEQVKPDELEVLERVFDRMVSRLNADDEDGPCTR